MRSRYETGRYENLDAEDRVCPFYVHAIGTGCHVIMACPRYEDIRCDFIQWAGGQDILDFDDNMSVYK